MRPLVLASLVAICGCDSAARMPTAAVVPSAVIQPFDAPDVLLVKTDAARDRVWVMRLDEIDVYDGRTRQLMRRISLPSWSVADLCGPGIAFDPSGSALVSHNLEPKLWRVDPNASEVQEHTIRLIGGEKLDVGFGTIVFGSDGSLYGVASSGHSVWRIDIGSASAIQVGRDAAVFNECAPQ